MNPEIKAQWVAALRSGEYEQGNGRLVTINPDGSKSYCCLGVLCDLAVKAGIGTWDHGGSRHITFSLVNADVDREPGNEIRLDDTVEGMVLPGSVINWAGLNGILDPAMGGHHNVMIDGIGYLDLDLVELNDDQGFTFDQIADVIESDL